jgi:hypothetical protein
MKLLRDLSPQLALAGIVALQISCGDSSGPGSAAASISANSSTTLTAAPGAQVGELPSVIVRDGSGNPIAGVAVTFAVTAGGGSVTGDHVTSDASGIATVGSWTLGATAGTNTLVASTGSLSVVFTANGADPCANLLDATLGATETGQLSTSDCALADGSFIDLYQVNLPTAGTYIFDEASSAFDSYLWLFSTAGPLVAVNDDIIPGTNTNSRIKAILPAGPIVVGANSFDPRVTGSYSLAAAASNAEVTNCEDVFVEKGISTSQSLSASDCAANGTFSDNYIIFLQPGQSITVSMTSTAVDSYLELTDASATLLASNDNIDGTTQNAQFAFTATGTQPAFYIIKARSAAAGATGAYTLVVQ